LNNENLSKKSKKKIKDFFFEDKGELNEISIKKKKKTAKESLESKELHSNQTNEIYEPLFIKAKVFKKIKGKTFVEKLADQINLNKLRKDIKEEKDKVNGVVEEEEPVERNKLDLWGDSKIDEKKLKVLEMKIEKITENKKKNKNNVFVKIPHPGQR
jgi:hypothetical protein